MKTYIVKGKDLLHLLGLAKLYIMFVIYQKQLSVCGIQYYTSNPCRLSE